MALDLPYPTPDTLLSTMAQWEGFYIGMGGASGITPGIGSEFAPSLDSAGRNAVIGSGAALLRGFRVSGSSSTGTAIPAASSQNRIDRLVLRLNRAATTAADWIKPVVIPGSPSASPQPPAVSQSATGLWDLTIARWTSASTGALSGLVDERYLMAGSPLSFSSKARPSASPRRLGIESDTGLPAWSDGSIWRNDFFTDTGDLTLPVTIPSRWKTFSPGLSGRRRGGIVTVEINLQRIGETLNTDNSDDSGGSQLTTLPAVLRPRIELHRSVVISGGMFGRIRYQTDGGVFVQATNVDVTVGRFVRFGHTFQN